MTDYKNLKLIASSSPHIRSNESTRTIMMDVIIAMIPALIMSVFVFGFRALALTLVSVAACVFWEWGYRKLLKKPQSIGDLSAVVTGMLLAFVCPPTLPYWMIIIGAFFAIVVVKQLFGGIGCNFMNPALVGRAVLLASYATAMTTWAVPMSKLSIFGSNADAVTSSTPLAIMKGGDLASLTSNYSVVDMFLGRIGGSLGEISALLLIVGGAYLIWRKVISWQTPAAYIATVAVLTFLFPKGGADNLQFMLYSIFGGGLFLGAFFMATDYVTSPITAKGQIVFGICLGILTGLFRIFGSGAEGVSYAIIFCNMLVPLIEKVTLPTAFGKGGKKNGSK